MHDLYTDYWRSLRSGSHLRIPLVLSLIAHLTVVAFVAKAAFQSPPAPIPIAYEVQLITAPTPEPEPEVAPVKAPPEPEPEPEPEPPPKPKPKPKPKPEPEPKKVVAKKEEKKPDPPPEPKPKPKPKPEVKKVPVEKPTPQPEVVAKAPPPKMGVQREQLPPLLNAWGRSVQRKVEKYWIVPGGISLSEANQEVHISFWVDRDGRLLERPKIVKDAMDPALGESGIRSILMAEPLPPLPMEYREKQQQVVYVFSLRN